MDFECVCPEPLCYCDTPVQFSQAEQDKVLLARIEAQQFEAELWSTRACEECTAGRHLPEPGGPRGPLAGVES